ncbi:MAG: tRNA lysidine(34) synthetase TilS [Bacteroidetes bacterium]|nr:tRNA lysidine(34) synthetase TilS [Bacteroidota bacterium]
MREEFLQYISKKNLCTSTDKILLAVSGGIDSMVMLRLFHDARFNVSVAHCNFKLRGTESDGDEEFVQHVCQKFSIPFFSKQFNTKEFAENNSWSTQMAARELRYRWFDELSLQNNFSCVATAHHLNDSIETVLLNLVRGTGMAGLDGIAPKNKKIIRPLLFATRSQIEIYARENKIEWREDSSNTSDDYQRNFVRHKITPLLKELNPSFENSFQNSIEKITGAVNLMGIGIAQWNAKFRTKKGEQINFSKEGTDSAGLLWNLIKSFGFNLDQCTRIIESIHGQSGKKFFAEKFELVIDREHLIISKIESEADEVLIERGQVGASLGEKKMKITEVDQIIFENNPSIALLDGDKLQFPLCWRTWKAGDYFHPLGMSHKKKLSDFFIDQKIPVSEKETITVLEAGGEIAWVVGYRIDERFKITTSSQQMLQFFFLKER